jgi:hypothetical protein
MSQFIESWKRKARELRVQVYALYLAYKDPRVPQYAKIFAARELIKRGKPVNKVAAAVIIAIWLLVVALVICVLVDLLSWAGGDHYGRLGNWYL